MILYTVQRREVYDALMKTGIYIAEAARAFEPRYLPAYRYLLREMRQRLPSSFPLDEAYRAVLAPVPVFAWYRWEGKRGRPDMRHHVWQAGEAGQPIALLTLEVPKGEALLTEFDLYHAVLNLSCLLKPEEDIREEISFPEIFLPETEELYREWDSVPLTTQATLFGLRREWLKRAEFFVSR